MIEPTSALVYGKCSILSRPSSISHFWYQPAGRPETARLQNLWHFSMTGWKLLMLRECFGSGSLLSSGRRLSSSTPTARSPSNERRLNSFLRERFGAFALLTPLGWSVFYCICAYRLFIHYTGSRLTRYSTGYSVSAPRVRNKGCMAADRPRSEGSAPAGNCAHFR